MDSRKRGRTWTAYWHVDGPNGSRQRSKGGFLTRADAQAHLTETLAAVRSGMFTEVNRISLGGYLLVRWLPSRKASLRPSTYDSYKTNIELHIVPAIGHIRLSSSPLTTSIASTPTNSPRVGAADADRSSRRRRSDTCTQSSTGRSGTRFVRTWSFATSPTRRTLPECRERAQASAPGHQPRCARSSSKPPTTHSVLPSFWRPRRGCGRVRSSDFDGSTSTSSMPGCPFGRRFSPSATKSYSAPQRRLAAGAPSHSTPLPSPRSSTTAWLNLRSCRRTRSCSVGQIGRRTIPTPSANASSEPSDGSASPASGSMIMPTSVLCRPRRESPCRVRLSRGVAGAPDLGRSSDTGVVLGRVWRVTAGALSVNLVLDEGWSSATTVKIGWPRWVGARSAQC